MSAKSFIRARLRWRRPVSTDIFLLGLAAPLVAETSRPGQFVHVRMADRVDPLLPRPFSIAGAGQHSVSRESDILEILVKRRGKATRLLTELEAGAELTVLGPIGNHFEPCAGTRTLWMVAGGIGVAPFFFLSTCLAAERTDLQLRLFYGSRSAKDAVDLSAVRELGVAVELASEDGSRGRRGLVSELTRQLLEEQVPDGLEILACGPHPMMLEIAHQARQAGVPCSASLENFMACGLGVCQGCVVPVKGPDGAVVYERVCREGPVFDAQRLTDIESRSARI